MFRKLLCVGLAAGVLTVAFRAQAQDAPRTSSGPQATQIDKVKARLQGLANELGLSDAQRVTIKKTLMDGVDEADKTVFAAQQKARRVKLTEHDQATIDASVAEIKASAVADLRKIADKVNADISTALTDDQKAKFKEMLAKKPGESGTEVNLGTDTGSAKAPATPMPMTPPPPVPGAPKATP